MRIVNNDWEEPPTVLNVRNGLKKFFLREKCKDYQKNEEKKN